MWEIKKKPPPTNGRKTNRHAINYGDFNRQKGQSKSKTRREKDDESVIGHMLCFLMIEVK